ncbi:BTAD domain-containing putative transcriptional regulator [Phytoactinopolyspora halotolerans]|uniref:AfsR/SARP family transcriptional regulator n=1 Tax=Phytoactinopolyspora halotolerans TaxID=1981512 RepID=A0A6L9S5P0_9ACTN|nr:BTAD domain-containing putative transcriptional regulator [Phytoactinopolyspora halotolerans]NEE00061.1 AfsR/SARP family transcriptional regulator [Phytoactinopolyspora halotolerans]
MRFEVLGPLAVWTDAGERVTVPGRKVRALLADLLVHEGRAVSVDRLVEDLWGDAAPADPSAALHVRVSQLRRALANAEPGGRELVASRPPGYALHAGQDALDVARFGALISQAQTADGPRARAGFLSEALGLWRGSALADFADDEFARAAVARWEEQRLAAIEAYAEARLELGEHRELVGELSVQVSAHPYRERLRAAHMRALHRAGRTTEALDSFQELRHRLAEELGLDPGAELDALHQAILSGDPSEDAPAPAPRPVRPATNLPAPMTELVGREHAVQRVRESLSASRLVTVTGPGGVGKTSVVLAVARSLVEAYPDGVRLVDLTTWDGTGDAAEPVLAVLAVPDAPGGTQSARDRLVDTLHERHMLLVLDNCEHVLGPVAELVGSLLPTAPGIRVLATSREPLRLRGEVRWELPPLDIPATDDAGRLAQSPAVRLFLERAGLPQDPEPATAAGAAEVCRRLDGIPLALELAAARVPALGVTELAARLNVPQDRFGLLGSGPRDAPARQRTLAAVIDWSWQLLTEPERRLLRRLAVHSGGCTLAAAEEVCADDPTAGVGDAASGVGVGDAASGAGVGAGAGVAASGDRTGDAATREEIRPRDVLDVLAGLVDRSLVARGEGPRFRLLESVAAFCLDQLREAGEEEAVRRRHADHYLALAEQADAHLRGPDQGEWLRRLDAETANLRAAMDTFRRTEAAEPALRLAGALVWYRLLRGRLTEARRDLVEALAVGGTVPATLRARMEAWCAGLAIRQRQAGPERVAEVLRLFDEADEPGADVQPDWAVARARAEWFLAASVIDFGDTTVTGELLERSLEMFRSTGDRWGEAAVLSSRAMLAHMRGDTAALEHDARRSARFFGELGDDWGVLQATDWLIGLADLTGDHAEAARLSRDGLLIAEKLGLWSDVANRFGWLAWISVQLGDYADAETYAEQGRQLAAQQGERVTEVFVTISLAFAARRAGALDRAEERLLWLLDSARQQQSAGSDPPYLSMVLVELGLLAGLRGDTATALARHREGFDVCAAQGSARGMSWALAAAADPLCQDGRADRAARALGTADAALGDAELPLSASDRDELARITAAVRAAEPDFAAQFARGRELTPEQARPLLDADRA